MAKAGRPEGDVSAIKSAIAAFAAGEDGKAGFYQSAIDAVADRILAAPGTLEAALAETLPAFASSPVISIVDETWLAGAVVQDGQVLHADAALGVTGDAETREALILAAGKARRAARAFATLRLADRSLAVAVAAKADRAGAWPLSADMRAALDAGPRTVAVLAFASAAHAGLEPIIAVAFGLTPGEARLAAILFRGLSVEEAAGEIGVSPATARKTARQILRKTGALRRAGLTARIAELLAGHYLRGPDRAALMREAFALSSAEALVAEAVAAGLTVPEIAARRAVSAHTVRAQLDAALQKTGAGRASDLARLLINLCALASWTSCSDPQRQDQRIIIAATRMIVTPEGRRIAAADYGPADGAPVMCFHPALSHRWVRRRLREAFGARGLRTISYDRAGCGLSDPADGHPFEVAADDAARVLDRFRIARTRLFASFGGAGPAIAFAARHPDRVSEAVLLMPRPSRSVSAHPSGIARLWRALADRPLMADRFYDGVRLFAGSQFWRWLQAQVARATPADRKTLKDDAYNDERLAELYASFARSSRGTLDLDRAYREGWAWPAAVGGTRWVVVDTSAVTATGGEVEDWSFLPGLERVKLGAAGRFAMHTHAAEIAACFSVRN